MFGTQLGLTTVATSDLKRALRALHRGDLTYPLNIEGFTRNGLQRVAIELLNQLRLLDINGAKAVLVCVLAERLEAEKRAQRPSPNTR